MIRTLYIRNFRNITDMRIALDRVTVVLGNNGAGKSSLAGAIQFGFAGHNDWTDAAGKGFKDLIRHGQAAASIDLDTGIGVVMRSLTGAGATLSVGERTGKDAEAVLAGKLPPREILDCMLSSDGFISLSTKQQQDILFRLSGGEVNAAWVSGKLTTEERGALCDALATRLQGAALIEHLYKTAYGQRTEANKQVKQIEAGVAEQTSATELPSADEENRLALELAKARKSLADRQQQAGAAQEQVRAHDAAVKRCERAREEFKAAQALLAEHGTRPGAVSDADFEALRTAMQRTEKALADAESAHFQAASPLIAARARVEQLETLGESCVLAPDIPCPMTQDQIATLREAARTAVGEAEKAEQTASAAMRKARTACTTATDAFAGAQSLRTAGEAWDARAASLNERLEQARATLHAAEAEYQANPAPDPTTIQSNLEAAQKRVDQAEADLRAVQEAMNADSQRKRRAAELDAARDRAKLLDGLVRQLAPTGLPSQAMQETVGNVLDQVNEALGFAGCTLKLTGEELVVTRGGVDTAVRLLSESEKLRVGAAISVAFAKLTGFGFVIVDAADRLDPDSRGPLVGMLHKSGIQALVLAVPLNGNRPARPGVVCYDLADGQVVPVEQNVAA